MTRRPPDEQLLEYEIMNVPDPHREIRTLPDDCRYTFMPETEELVYPVTYTGELHCFPVTNNVSTVDYHTPAPDCWCRPIMGPNHIYFHQPMIH